MQHLSLQHSGHAVQQQVKFPQPGTQHLPQESSASQLHQQPYTQLTGIQNVKQPQLDAAELRVQVILLDMGFAAVAARH